MSDPGAPARMFALILVTAALCGCANGPLKTAGVATGLTPANVAERRGAVGKTVLWGGVIVAARNLAERTRLEIVAYPLDPGSQRPRVEAEPLGRFLAYQGGYLETAEFSPGRRITVRGTLTGFRTGYVGEAHYTYPTVRIEALELWPRGRDRDTGPNFHFGIGVIFSG